MSGCQRDGGWCDGSLCSELGIRCQYADVPPKGSALEAWADLAHALQLLGVELARALGVDRAVRRLSRWLS